MSSLLSLNSTGAPRALHSFPTRRSSDLTSDMRSPPGGPPPLRSPLGPSRVLSDREEMESAKQPGGARVRSEEHTSELQSPDHLVRRLLLEKKNDEHSSLTKPRIHTGATA